MPGHIRAILAATALLAATSTAQTTVLSDNLDKFTALSEYADDNEWLTAGFATDAHVYHLTEVQLKGYAFGTASLATGASSLALEVWSSTGAGLGEPGALVGKLTTSSETMFTADGITLAPSTHYWIVLYTESASTQYAWRWTPEDTGAGVGFTHTWGRSIDSGGNWDIFDSAPMQMKVTAEQVTVWTDLGQALAGLSGEPVLQGSGSLYPDTAADLLLTIAKPGAAAFFVVSSTAANLPFKGGTLVPSWTTSVPAHVDITGKVALKFRVPLDLPSGSTFYMQWWIKDPGGPEGFAASNGLQATVP